VKKISTFLNNGDINRFRIIIQILTFILLMYGGLAHISISERIPTFACPYNPASGGTCYLIAIQHQFHTTWANLASYSGVAILKGLGLFLVFFLFLNKAWCGFVCPLGTIQDWITGLRRKMGFRFARYEDNNFKRLKLIKYILLVLLIGISLSMSNSIFGLPHASHDMASPFCQVCPGRTVLPLFAGDTSQLVIDFSSPTTLVMSALGMIVTGLFFVGAFVKKRFFCLFCPMSALQFIFSKFAFLRLTKDGEKCTTCGNCSRVCDVGIREIADDVISKNIVTDDCMMCFKCVGACPEKDCLKVTFTKIPLFSATEEGFFKRYEADDNKEIKL